MAEPPRLSAILLPWDKSVIYFVTMCVKDRRKVLANPETFEAMKRALAELQKWRVLAGVIMPDHAHWIVSPVENRDLSVGDFAHGFKRVLRRKLAVQPWEWQRGCFDRLLRSDENLWSKWIYVKDNPVRHGLVDKVDDWPSYLDYINEAPREAVSFPYRESVPIRTIGVGGI
jgi:REP element-mobilizing transposase RayT